MQVDKIIIMNGLGADYVPPSMPVDVRAGAELPVEFET